MCMPGMKVSIDKDKPDDYLTPSRLKGSFLGGPGKPTKLEAPPAKKVETTKPNPLLVPLKVPGMG